MKLFFLNFLLSFTFVAVACGSGPSRDTGTASNLAEQNLLRAMEITDQAVAAYFTGKDMAMARFYNPYTDVRSTEKGSVWMYTSAIEAVNTILHALKSHRAQGQTTLYATHYTRYNDLLRQLFDNLVYYEGTFELTSYTQTKEWTVYGVHRAATPGTAKVAGIENVYDDQQWLVRELLHAHKLTGDQRYLSQAEYLTEYVLDGWDSTLDESGKENGGIPWGPGYTTKHSCSNGPFISSLVWLHEQYTGSDEEITHRYITADNKRETNRMKKSDYYLQFAESIYNWQKSMLLRNDGVYDDFLGGCGSCKIKHETVNGIEYKANTPLRDRVGPAYSYNAGAMLSGAVDLYRATGNATYLADTKKLADDSFKQFAKNSDKLPGYYEYAVSGFNNWFNGVLMRSFIEAQPHYPRVAPYIHTFQQNLDYGYANFLHKGMLPPDLLHGWTDKNKNAEGMFAFSFAAEYALLSEYALSKQN